MNNKNKISPKGNKALKLGLDPRLCSMLLNSETNIEKTISCILAALIAERDILINSYNSDITERVLIFIDYLRDRKSFRSSNINYSALEQGITLAKSFAQIIGISIDVKALSLNDLHFYIGPLLLKAYPDRLAKLRNKNSNRYLLANGRGVSLRESDSIEGESWLVVCDCDGKNKDGFIFVSSSITVAQITKALKEQFVEKTQYFLDNNKEKVIGRTTLTYKTLVIEESLLSSIPQKEFELCIKDILIEEGLNFLNWTAKCESWFLRAKWLGEILDNFSGISKENLIDKLDSWLLPYISSVKTIKQLRQLNIYDLLVANLTWDQQQILIREAPEYYQTPSHKKVKIRYSQHQNPTVAVILQEMFGQLESPLLANGTVPLRFELLSPARRPIQTTSDLGNFWKSSYFDVAKDMRGKYPKHRWPEKPLEERPGKSIKLK